MRGAGHSLPCSRPDSQPLRQHTTGFPGQADGVGWTKARTGLGKEDCMDVFGAIGSRYSVRGYKPDPVSDELLGRVLEAARQAPTAANRQPFRIIVIHTKGREEDLKRVYGRPWFLQAPLVLVVVAVPGEAWRRSDDKPYDEVDATIAMDHLVLAATALGLGTCWIAAFNPTAVREVLALPADVEPIALTPLGYPDKGRTATGRRPLDELVRYECW